ncbi:MAG TPA: GNAT family N-acetyltransferase [Dyella sp.]|nr:GNAT family N-acetyltransferase [Dyella sp.]
MHALGQLPAFPLAATSPSGSGLIPGREVQLRAAGADDMPFLRALFHAVKEEELGLAGWPEPAKQALLDQQFALQHRQYVSAYASADFWIVEHRQQPIGRYYLLRESLCYHIVDIMLASDWRHRGIGSLLLSWTQSLAQAHGATAISLQVDERNVGAQRLYAKHGFAQIARETPHIVMHWNRPVQLNTA